MPALNNHKLDQFKKRRTQRAFSLILVMSLGLITTLVALAITESLFPISRYAANQAVVQEATSIAEDVARYGVAVLNQAAANSTLNSVTSPISVPSTISRTAKVALTFQQVPTAESSAATFFSNNNSTLLLLQDFREITAVATIGIYSRTIKVIIGPSQISPGTNKAYFNQALSANSALNINNVNILLDPAYNIQSSTFSNPLITSNQQISITGNQPLTVQGSINAYNQTGVNSLITPPLSQGAPSLIVSGNVSYSGQSESPSMTSQFLTDGLQQSVTGANVLGDNVNGGSLAGAVSNNASSTVTAPSPIQNAVQSAQISSGVVNAGSTTISNSNISSPQPGVVSDIGAINLTSNSKQVVLINPGTYTASAVDIGANGTLQLTSGTSPAPVQIYLQGTSGGSPLSISGSLTGSTVPSNFQVFYNGQQQIQVVVNSKNFYGLIYAPNANVSIDTTSGSFYGSVVADGLSVTSLSPTRAGNFFYNPSLATMTQKAGGAPGYSIASDVQGFNILSWREISGLN